MGTTTACNQRRIICQKGEESLSLGQAQDIIGGGACPALISILKNGFPALVSILKHGIFKSSADAEPNSLNSPCVECCRVLHTLNIVAEVHITWIKSRGRPSYLSDVSSKQRLQKNKQKNKIDRPHYKW